MGTTVFERRLPAPIAVEASLRDTALGVFWLDDVPRPEHPSLTGHVTADLAIVLVDALPRTATGKLQRFALRERLPS